jgi:signal transduction histidine kinase
MQDMQVGISALSRKVFIPLILTVAFAAALVFVLSRHIVKPIRNISFGAMELARGNYDWRVKPTTRDEIGELAVAFNRMAEELKLQDGLRNTFVANVSHELRTPLASVQGFIQGMLDGAIEQEDRDKYLEVVLGETKRMSTLITDLLSLAKIESGKFPMEYSEFDINELLRRGLLMFEQRIEAKNIDVDVNLCEEKINVWADEDRISQVITNLIDNAVKFSGENGKLKVWTFCTENKVHVNIADTGIGIPADDQPYVFERFFKVDKSHSQGTPGTGIGLSIVKRIIAQHGETIGLQSQEGQGTTFTFTLTRSLSSPEHKTRPKAAKD